MDLRKEIKSFLKKPHSEEVFEITPQPPETCPMIDKMIENLSDYNESLRELEKEIHSSILISDSCGACDIDDVVEEFNIILDELITNIDQKMETIDSLIKELNDFRSLCEELRINGKENKKIIWQQIEECLTIENKKFLNIRNPVIKELSSIANQKITLSFNQLNSQNIKIDFDLKIGICDQCEIASDLDARINKLINYPFKDQIFSNSNFEEMVKNYDRLYQWNLEIKNINIKKIISNLTC